MQPKKIRSILQLSSLYHNYFFDLDGVFWITNKPIPSALEAMMALRAQNKRLYFITNNSSRSSAQIIKKFKNYGSTVFESEIYTANHIASRYFKQYYPNIKNVLLLGSEVMRVELQRAGFNVTMMKEPVVDSTRRVECLLKQYDPIYDALLLGVDTSVTYNKICLACIYLQKRVPFFAANPDNYTMSQGYRIPGNGAILKAIELGCNMQATVMGKPNPFILNQIITAEGLKKEQCLMVGDNLDTDIQFGINAGIDTLCVLTGVTNYDEIMCKKTPQFYVQNL